MRSNRFWINRYQAFIKKVLNQKADYCKSKSLNIKEEMESNYELYFEELENNFEQLKKYVIFFTINHELNLLDPIGGCYPSIRNEYSYYAWGIYDDYLTTDENWLFSMLKKQIISMWKSGHSKPDNDRRKIEQGCRKLQQALIRLRDKEKSVKGIFGNDFNEALFWKREYYYFQNKVLGQERMNYEYEATLFLEEAQEIQGKIEGNLQENPDEFILFLYINHELNRIDPSGLYYPGLAYQYKAYAWDLVQTFKLNIEQFQQEFIKKIEEMYNQEGREIDFEEYNMKWRVEDFEKKLKKIIK